MLQISHLAGPTAARGLQAITHPPRQPTTTKSFRAIQNCKFSKVRGLGEIRWEEELIPRVRLPVHSRSLELNQVDEALEPVVPGNVASQIYASKRVEDTVLDFRCCLDATCLRKFDPVKDSGLHYVRLANVTPYSSSEYVLFNELSVVQVHGGKVYEDELPKEEEIVAHSLRHYVVYTFSLTE